LNQKLKLEKVQQLKEESSSNPIDTKEAQVAVVAAAASSPSSSSLALATHPSSSSSSSSSEQVVPTSTSTSTSSSTQQQQLPDMFPTRVALAAPPRNPAPSFGSGGVRVRDSFQLKINSQVRAATLHTLSLAVKRKT
jgi:hypothetical protein